MVCFKAKKKLTTDFLIPCSTFGAQLVAILNENFDRGVCPGSQDLRKTVCVDEKELEIGF